MFGWKAQGQPNEYVIFNGDDWFAFIQLNGEMHAITQENHLNNIIKELNSYA